MKTGGEGWRANIKLELSELVLHGFSPMDRYRISDALIQELERLLETEGAPDAWFLGEDQPVVTGGAITVSSGASPEEVGQLAAQALMSNLGGGNPAA